MQPGSLLAGLTDDEVDVSCFHHQCVDRLGRGFAVTARAADGTVEAVERPGSPGWLVAVQASRGHRRHRRDEPSAL